MCLTMFFGVSVCVQLVCFYFVLTTFMTVGFGLPTPSLSLMLWCWWFGLKSIPLAGDIYALNKTERVSLHLKHCFLCLFHKFTIYTWISAVQFFSAWCPWYLNSWVTAFAWECWHKRFPASLWGSRYTVYSCFSLLHAPLGHSSPRLTKFCSHSIAIRVLLKCISTDTSPSCLSTGQTNVLQCCVFLRLMKLVSFFAGCLETWRSVCAVGFAFSSLKKALRTRSLCTWIFYCLHFIPRW